jgi:hypothetical protein
MTSYWRWIAGGAALTLAILAVAYLPGHGHWLPAAAGATAAGGPAAGRPGGRAAPAPTVTTVTTPPGGPAAVAAAAAPAPAVPRPLARALGRWNSGRGGPALAALSSAVGGATQDGGLQQYAAMRQACAQVTTAAAAAKSGPPIPSAALQRWYASALAAFAAAAADCESGITVRPDGDEYQQTHQNQRLLHRAGAEFAAGGTDLYRATATVQELILSR